MVLLQWQEFSSWLQQNRSKYKVTKHQEGQLSEVVKNCRDSADCDELLQQRFSEMCKKMEDLHLNNLFASFKEEKRSKSQTFRFGDMYIHMIELLLQFIRAERTADWLMHLSSTAGMAPFFFAIDRTNYSRWIPIYLSDTNKLPESHPAVYAEFMAGNHAVSHASNPLRHVWKTWLWNSQLTLIQRKREAS